jgi:hypothetical protein
MVGETVRSFARTDRAAEMIGNGSERLRETLERGRDALPALPALSAPAPQTLAKGLGWFSVALGLAELVAPGQLARTLGMRRQTPLLRAYGARELANGVGILANPDRASWLWGRVGGDLLDLGTLGQALRNDRKGRHRGALVTAIGAVLAVTALDVLCARQLGREDGGR